MSATQPNISKEWAVVYGNHILLRADTKPALRKKMNRTKLPGGADVVALPKAYASFYV